ncbi:MAG: aldo/keto reductase [Sphingomonas sp.]|jgi:aryl-alcohol dehydrogenase-like predicted oxidoreductase
MKPLPAFGLGCARIGSLSNSNSTSDSIALIRGAMAMGVTLLDTANIYGQGDSERVIGRAIAGVRDEAFVVTKGGLTFSRRMLLLRPFKPLLRRLLMQQEMKNAVVKQRTGQMRANRRASAIVASLDRSLRRLQTDRVDAFLLHSPAADVLALPDAAEALTRVRASGRAERVGVACDDLAALEAALAIGEVDILELPWDVIARIADGPVSATIAERGIAVIAREVLRFQPGVDPVRASANAHATPIVSNTLIGSRRLDRVRAIVEGVRAMGSPA